MLKTFNLEESLKLGASHLESLVDEQGRTRFDIFLTEPAEAVFDWPDFVDLPSRYWEAAVFVEPVIGRKIESVDRLRKWLFSHFKEDGLAYRPESLVSRSVAELFDQSRLLYALVTWRMYAPSDTEVYDRLIGLLNGLYNIATFTDEYAYINKIGVYFGGTLIRPLVMAGLVLNDPKWINFAGAFSRGIIYHSDLIKEDDGSFEGHVHGALGTIAGIISYAVIQKDDDLLQRAVKAFEYARSITTDFGFIPEVAGRKDDVVACETCTLMDYLDVAILLAKYVDEKYWDVVEKAARNHLVESQIRDASWLPENPAALDEPDIIRRNLRKSVIGSFAGWSSPNGLLAYEDELHGNWVKTEELKPRYLHKTRAVQNCCAGAGLRAIYSVWANIMSYKDGLLNINMLIDRKTQDAEIVSYQPYEGKAIIKLKRDTAVRFRVGDNCCFDDVCVKVNGKIFNAAKDGYYIIARGLKSGDELEVTFPLKEMTETVSVGNKGFLQYHYDVMWKGNTVVRLEPDSENATSGHTQFAKESVRLFYGLNNPAPIYKRGDYLSENAKVQPSETVEFSDTVNWFNLI